MPYQPAEKLICLFCEKVTLARKLCRYHYYKYRRMELLDTFEKLGAADVFHQRYKKMKNGCWEWTGTRNKFGYGILLLPGERPVRAHRFSFEQSYGPFPQGKIVMHLCDNPPCVNPEHLKMGTRADNNRDKTIKRRHWKGRLTAQQLDEIRNSRLSQTVLGKHYGVSVSHISRIRNGLVCT